MEVTEKRKASALRTLLETLDVPDMRRDTTRHANIRWLSRNLAINNRNHPMFETARGLILWLIDAEISRLINE